MRGKRILGALVTATLLASLTVAPAQAAFSDTAGHWAAEAVGEWSEQYGIIRGYEDGTFRPDNPISRGAMAAIIDRVMHYQKQSPASTFTDTAGTDWESVVLKLNAAGVMLGDGGKAKIWNDINRQEAMTMVGRAFGLPEADTLPTFADADAIGSFARGYIATMESRGYITDVQDGKFRPREPITRAEFLNLMNNMISALYQTAGTYTDTVEGDVLVNTPGVVFKDMTITGDLIIAPGATAAVTLQNTPIQGNIRNFSGIDPTTGDAPVPPPVLPGIDPKSVYTPGVPTGETFGYNGKKIPVYQGMERSKLYPGDFSWSGDRLVYNGGAYQTRFGIDVSAYQNRSSANNTIDWNAVRDSGVSFAMVRAGFRGTSSGALNTDAFVTQNIDGAMAAGIETGVYFFAQAITVEEAIEEADYVINILKNHQINGPVAYDWEMSDSSYRVYGTTPEMATACAVAFCERVAQAGYTPMVYAGQYVTYVKYDMGALSKYLYWYPEYKSDKSEKLYPTIGYQMDVWQFSSNCSIPGIGGRVDANIQFIR